MTVLSLINLQEKIKSSELLWIISFALLTAVAAQFTIPVKPVPFTFQTVFVILSGAFLGPNNGALSQMLYLFFGIIGLPVFAQIPDATVGIGRLLGPTGGYLFCFPLAAYVMGLLINFSKNYFFVVCSMFAANLVVVLGGAVYLDLFFIHDFSETLKIGITIFSLWSVLKVFLASFIFFLVQNNFKKV